MTEEIKTKCKAYTNMYSETNKPQEIIDICQKYLEADLAANVFITITIILAIIIATLTIKYG